MAMKVEREEPPAKPAGLKAPIQDSITVPDLPGGIPSVRKNVLVPLRTGALQTVQNGFKAFENKVAIIQAVSSTPREVDQLRRYGEWLHSFTVTNDNLYPQRIAKSMPYSKLEDVYIDMNTGLATTRQGRVKKRDTVGKVRACWLQKDDSWKDHEKTKNYYLDRTERSIAKRKQTKVGHLQLVHSKPSYPDPWDSPRPLSPWKLIRKTMNRGAVESHTTVVEAVEGSKVQASNVFVGPPRPPESREYDYPSEWEFDSEVLLGAPSDFISRAFLFNKVGHCNEPKSVPWALYRKTLRDDQMLIKLPGFFAEGITPFHEELAWIRRIDCEGLTDFLCVPRFVRIMNERDLSKCTPTPVDDEARYDFYWRQKHCPRESCNLLEMITKPPLNGITWELQRSLVRRKGFLATRCKGIKLRSSKDDKNAADARLRMYENQHSRGKISIEDLYAAKSKLRPLIALMEANRLLPVAVGKPYGDYSREEKIAMIRFGMANGILVGHTPIVEVPYNSVETIDYVEPDTVDVITDHSVCRVMSDTLEAAVAVFDSTNDVTLSDLYNPNKRVHTTYFQLPSGLWVPKRSIGYKTLKILPIEGPPESNISVKSCEDKEEAKPLSIRERLIDWFAAQL